MKKLFLRNLNKKLFRILFLTVVTVLLFGVAIPVVSAAEWTHPTEYVDFTDVTQGAWFHDYVSWAYVNAITTGVGDGTRFLPNDNVTRGQFATFLWRIAGRIVVDATHDFTDVSDNHFFSGAVAWAAEIGVTTGRSPTTFAPGNDITREQIVTMLHRFIRHLELNDDAPDDALYDFHDSELISEFAIEAMQWAAGNEIIGVGGDLNPGGYATRAQTVAMLNRVVAKFDIHAPQSPLPQPPLPEPPLPEPEPPFDYTDYTDYIDYTDYTQPAWVTAASIYSTADTGVVNFRIGPSTDYDIIRPLRQNTSVEVLEHQANGWSSVRQGGVTGYISSDLIRPVSTDVQLLTWPEARPRVPMFRDFHAIDVRTGALFNLRAFSLGGHADVEPPTLIDTEIIFWTRDGVWSWDARPVWVIFDNQIIAAALNGMPHDVSTIQDNGMDGHLCLHFHLTETRSLSYQIDLRAAVLEAYNAATGQIAYY